MCSQAVLAAPPTIEIYSGSGTGQLGPRADTTPHRFLLNRNNPSDNTGETYAPTTRVSYTITNSVFNGAVYSGQGSAENKPELTFGGNGDASSVTGVNILRSLNAIGSAQSNMFASSLQNATSGCSNGMDKVACLSTNGGIDATENQGVSFLAMTKGLSSVSGARNARTKVGTVSISFNRPVNNPILQAAGMGAYIGRLGFSAEFTLTGSNTPVTLKRIAGNKNFAVNGNNIGLTHYHL